MQTTSTQAALSATLHCLTGCAAGEIIGMVTGMLFGWSNLVTTIVSIALAFLVGYSLSLLPLLKAGLAPRTAMVLVLGADTLSIFTMEVVDTLIMLLVPGALNASLVNPLFWLTLTLALFAAFWAAFPVNRFLLNRGMGHALVHNYHQG